MLRGIFIYNDDDRRVITISYELIECIPIVDMDIVCRAVDCFHMSFIYAVANIYFLATHTA